MKRPNRTEGLLWFFLGIGLCLASIQLNLGGLHKPGPGFLPFVSGALLALLGLILAYSSLGKALGPKESIWGRNFWGGENWPNVLSALFSLFGFLILLHLLGFILTSFLFLFSLFKFSTPNKWLVPLVFAGLSTILAYLIFSVWLQCQFPRGIFGAW
jgi:putative tricarboxylic transport membrane protein